MQIKGIIATIVSAILFGLTPIVAKLSYASGANAQTLVFYRNLFAIPLLYAVCRTQNIPISITKKEGKDIVLIGVFGIAATTLMLYLSYLYIDVGTATTLHFLYPVFVALICRFYYKEHLSKAKVISLTIAMLGILFFLEELDASSVIGLILSLSSGLTYGYYMIGVEKTGLKKRNPFLLSMYFAIAVSIVMFAYNIVFQTMVWSLPLDAYLYMFLVSLGTSFLGVVLLQVGISYLGATMAAIFCLFEPIASVLAGMLFLNESLSFMKIIGCIIILGAVTCLVVWDNISTRKR